MEIREKVRKIADSHSLMRLATVDANGLPKVRSVDFAADKADESVLYFMTFKQSAKVDEILKNQNVHITVDKEANSMQELGQLLYFKGAGKASLVQSPDEMQKGMGLILEKYPYLKDMPGDPSMMALVKVELGTVEVTDNNVGFGHVDAHRYR